MSDEKLSPYQILEKIYSEDGYSHGLASIKIKDFCNIIVLPCQDNKFCINFKGSKPIIKIGKGISVQTTIAGIKLDEKGGTVEVDKFPDIPFYYHWIIKDNENSFSRPYSEILSATSPQKLIDAIIEAVVDTITNNEEKK